MTLQRVYLVAGELSGDILGAGLMRELKARYPGVEFRGIGGPRMQAEGMESRFPLETLAVMGLVEVLKHLPELIRVRRTLKAEALAWQPDIMLGIDAPDFNLGLERQLRETGITTAHYVSPSVWAWRQGRVKGISKSVDGMLTLLPFEAAFYRKHRVPVAFVGHPLADEMPLENDRIATRQALKLAPDSQVLALLPGSRANEIRFLGDTFLNAAEQLCQRHPTLQVVIPAATADRRREISALLASYPLLVERTALLDGQAREAMVASDVVLLASGTAALEAMLCHRTMLVAYKMAPATHWLAKRMVKTQWVSLPNLIAQETLVPELIQDAASPEAIADQLSAMLADEASRHALETRFAEMHATLQRNASRRAAEAINLLAAGQPLESVDGH
ncbi:MULTISPECIES: lipid-A-disaccharide synthase [Halomonadaceae]|jgi:lipid-A-disaccharide synthase|uniref:lipid-A-disaccharide synthase n=1 Tax=Halomonadaceae TaxID=28256 RepID=UPI0012F18607|nr:MULTISPECIES: lipid-A-disaccharide synthase [Halomonas]UEQ04737.1 lipid-A-disaccharide synthase [Halomonas profundus]CAD5249643.1 tetraacyldisaccharide-1-P synthase [Halomonas sp. I3]CAD5272058.1 tetraacyldisaccharide-1-P synthase [Halomonas sp. 113]CAD5273787.1 tetraacyldisaccharide-1-P synthase [Halomonas sp. 59]CAD5279831.1 tetraacyldisaccharide-1-P synthase [Halomonas sp. 156]|tara:strand:+ start:3490 stop:4662 length:1173 start_codon:yes stop_codon:yes gene_type:complete